MIHKVHSGLRGPMLQDVRATVMPIATATHCHRDRDGLLTSRVCMRAISASSVWTCVPLVSTAASVCPSESATSDAYSRTHLQRKAVPNAFEHVLCLHAASELADTLVATLQGVRVYRNSFREKLRGASVPFELLDALRTRVPPCSHSKEGNEAGAGESKRSVVCSPAPAFRRVRAAVTRPPPPVRPVLDASRQSPAVGLHVVHAAPDRVLNDYTSAPRAHRHKTTERSPLQRLCRT
jgi:hypothetical protein